MEICGEHGEEIAHTGRDCPACEQVESMAKDHTQQVEDLESQLADKDSEIEDLTTQLEEEKEKK